MGAECDGSAERGAGKDLLVRSEHCLSAVTDRCST